MRTDFENLSDGDTITLHPNAENPLHKKPGQFMFQSGYFYSMTPGDEPGPDYYFGDVLAYNVGFEAP